MLPLRVVEGEIVGQRARAPARARIRAVVGPLINERANEAFGLAIRLRAVRACEALADAERERRLREGQRAIAAAVVGEDALDRDAERGVPRDRAREEARGGLRGLLREHFDIRKARVIVDRDVHELPAAAVCASRVVAVDAMPDASDARELLDVEMHELTGSIALVAHDAARPIDGRQAAQAESPQLTSDRREGDAAVLRDAAPGPALAAPFANLAAPPPRNPRGRMMRARRARLRVVGALEPRVDGLTRHREVARHGADACAGTDTTTRLLSQVRRQSCMLVGVHGASGVAG